MRTAQQGSGPLVLLLHGWPESWYSWRLQIPVLAAAGYCAVAPDMRGYGDTDAPDAIEAYGIRTLCDDVVGLVDHFGEERAVVVGHDWGAIVAWHCALLAPERFSAVAALSVPYAGRPREEPVAALRRRWADDFFYMLYFQEPGVAESEFDADPRRILSRLYASPDTPREAPEITDRRMSAGGWACRLGAPKAPPPWLATADLDYYVGEFRRAGFRGGINYYRNFTRNWNETGELEGVRVQQPALFVAGEGDNVIRGKNAEQLKALLDRGVADLRKLELIPGVGHWVQQESPERVNDLLRAFLAEVAPG